MRKPGKIAIIGLGYVGLPLAVEFGKQYPTLGFDVKAARVAALQAGNDETGEVAPEELAAARARTLAGMVAGQAPGWTRPIRVWIGGCSAGSEASAGERRTASPRAAGAVRVFMVEGAGGPPAPPSMCGPAGTKSDPRQSTPGARRSLLEAGRSGGAAR